jgi:hypothetical protein
VVLYANIAACELKLVSFIMILMSWLGPHGSRKLGNRQSNQRPLRSTRTHIITSLFGGEQKQTKLLIHGLP